MKHRLDKPSLMSRLMDISIWGFIVLGATVGALLLVVTIMFRLI